MIWGVLEVGWNMWWIINYGSWNWGSVREKVVWKLLKGNKIWKSCEKSGGCEIWFF